MTGVEEMKRLDLFFKKSCSQLIPYSFNEDFEQPMAKGSSPKLYRIYTTMKISYKQNELK